MCHFPEPPPQSFTFREKSVIWIIHQLSGHLFYKKLSWEVIQPDPYQLSPVQSSREQTREAADIRWDSLQCLFLSLSQLSHGRREPVF